MKEQDPKQRFLLTMAICLTFVVLMQYLLPAPQSAPEPQPAERSAARVVPAGGAESSAAAAPETTKDFHPDGDYMITVRVGEEGINAKGYEATFSTVGGGLSTYRLLGYFRRPGDSSPENRIVLLDRMGTGRDSLRVERISTGHGRQEQRNVSMRDARYELIEAPTGAVIAPEPAKAVKRGDNLVFRTVVGEWELLRTYRFPVGEGGAGFTMNFELQWRNLSGERRLLNFDLVGPAGLIADDDSIQFSNIEFLTARQPSAASTAMEIERKPLRDLVNVKGRTDRDNRANLAWIGAKNRFFNAIVTASERALDESNGATRQVFGGTPDYLAAMPELQEVFRSQPTIPLLDGGTTPAFQEVSLTVEPTPIEPGGIHKAGYLLYAGPSVDHFMTDADERLEGVVHYSWGYLNVLSRWMVRLLTFLDGILGNYGLAIIVMTIIIKLLLHPLNRKSFVSMNKMSKLAPMMKEIQKKYASDRQRMQLEMNKFYKENGVSMAGGCLPMFFQLPIFFALYGAFSQGFSMRHAPFLAPWIKDLSRPDSIHELGFTIPLLNSSHISLLPILYFILNYIQMSMQPKPSDPQQAQQQKIMKFMPLMFVFIFYAMPAGLVLYFTVSALCSVAENTWMRKAVLPRLGLGDSPAAVETAQAAVRAGTGAAPAETKKKKRNR